MDPRLVVVATLLLVSTVEAQVVWEDPLNDSEVGYVSASNESAPIVWAPAGPSPSYDFTDLSSIGIVDEQAESLTFAATVRGVAGTSADYQLGRLAEYAVNFTYGDVPHRAVFIYDRMTKDTAFALEAHDGVRWYATYRAAAEELAPGSWEATAPKTAIRDANGLPSILGGTLEDLRAGAYRSDRPFDTELYSPYQCVEDPPEFAEHNECGYRYRDLVEDGAPLGSYELSARPAGDLFLSAVDPIRYSNGLETTYIYEIQVGNPSADARHFRLRVDAVPDDWRLNAPEQVQVEAGQYLSFPLAVGVPFVHQHGATELIDVVLLEDGDEQARTSVGVTWPAIPQPSGHHARIHVHGDGQERQWFNTVQEEEGSVLDVPGRLGGFGVMQGGNTHQFRWSMPLSPNLQVGVDGDLDRPLRGTLSFLSSTDAVAELQVELRLEDAAGGEHPLANYDLQDIDLRAQQPTELDLEAEMDEDWDWIAPSPDQNLHLSVLLYLRPTSPGSDVAVTLSGEDSYLDLPLFEYQDLGGLATDFDPFLSAEAAQAVLAANPGGLAQVKYLVRNSGPAVDMDLQVLGNLDAETTVDPPRIRIPEAGSAEVSVYVRVPETDQHGDRITLFLYGTEADGDLARFFAPAIVEVRTDATIDAATAPEAGQDSPALPVASLLMLLVLAMRRSSK